MAAISAAEALELRRERRDRRLAINQSGKRKLVVVIPRA